MMHEISGQHLKSSVLLLLDCIMNQSSNRDSATDLRVKTCREMKQVWHASHHFNQSFMENAI